MTAAKAQAVAPKQAASSARPRQRVPATQSAGEVHEREADRMADAITAASGFPRAGRPTAPGGPFFNRAPPVTSLPAASSSPISRVTNSSGRPLDAATRRLMERGFGHDFGKVRIHTDGAAAKAVDAMHARAMASGNDIAFGSGLYHPATSAGGHLLAHELAHVLQDARRSSPTPVRLKKKPAEKPFYQEALDRLAYEKKTGQVTLYSGRVFDIFEVVPVIEKFIAFAEAIEAEDLKAIPGLLKDFTASDTNKLGLVFPSDPLVNTTITRLLLLGLEAQAQTFRAWYLKHEQQASSPSMSRKGFRSKEFIWEQVYDELSKQIPEKGGEPAVKVLDALMLLFGEMRDELFSLDDNAIKEDRRSRAEISQFYGSMALSSDVSISVYADHLVSLFKECFGAIQAAYQVVLDQATADLAAGKGTKFLEIAKDRLRKKLNVLISPKEKEKNTERVEVDITRSEFKKGGGKHLDYFAKGKEAGKREAIIHFYDKEMFASLADEMKLDFGRILDIRLEQIDVIEQIYGLAKDEQSGQLTADTQENAAAIAKLGKTGLRLDNDDDWRRFLLEKYEEARNNGLTPAEALSSVVKLLRSFLHAFTTHTPYDIDDYHDNYLSREFPRAMTGQLIQDCGVYALRNAYMLSLLREHKELQLRFRFIVLPVHVGLIITGKAGSGLPTFIAHNDALYEYSDDRIAELETAWIKLDENGKPRPGAAAPGGAAGAQPGGAGAAAPILGGKDEDQFLAELSGANFVESTNLPFKLLDVPTPRGGPNTIKADLWSAFTKRVAPTKLFGPETENPKSPVYQFQLKYLKVLQMTKTHYNESLLPFWNKTGFPAWRKAEPELTAALAKLNGAKTADEQKRLGPAFDAAVRKYETVVKPALDKVIADFEPIKTARTEIADALRAHPEALAKDAGVVHSARPDAIVHPPWWSTDTQDHFKSLERRVLIPPPYATADDLLLPIN